MNKWILNFILMSVSFIFISCNPYEGKIIKLDNDEAKYRGSGYWIIPPNEKAYILKNTSKDKIKTYTIKMVRERYDQSRDDGIKYSIEKKESFFKETLSPGEEVFLTASTFKIDDPGYLLTFDNLISIAIVGAVIEND